VALNPEGRPSDYREQYNEQARKLCLLGATDVELADFFGVSEPTLNAWKQAHPEFLKSMNLGKIIADAEVAEKLYHRACGYSHEAVKIFMPAGAADPVYAPYTEHYPPDTMAATRWLGNRQRRLWSERTEVAVTGPNGGPVQSQSVTVPVTDPIEAARIYQKIMGEG
jgi:hypothetical protein